MNSESRLRIYRIIKRKGIYVLVVLHFEHDEISVIKNEKKTHSLHIDNKSIKWKREKK